MYVHSIAPSMIETKVKGKKDTHCYLDIYLIKEQSANIRKTLQTHGLIRYTVIHSKVQRK